MAETTTEIVTKNEEDTKAPKNNNIFSLLPKFDIKINLPFFNQEPKGESILAKEEPKNTIVSTEPETPKPDFVRILDPRPKIPPPLELEAEQPVGRTSNPVVLWQVYAITGFMVVRWVWARWKERKERGAKKESDDDQSPTDDEDSHLQ